VIEVFVLKLKCVYVGYSKKCAENTCIIEESISHVKQHKSGESVTVLPEIFKFYLLLYASYSQRCFHFKIDTPPSTGFIYCNWLDFECHHLHRWPQVTIQLPLQGTIGGFVPK
jgi:hypothetical protein